MSLVVKLCTALVFRDNPRRAEKCGAPATEQVDNEPVCLPHYIQYENGNPLKFEAGDGALFVAVMKYDSYVIRGRIE